MKRAYSPTHGTVVEAVFLTHQDCRDDRVSCEICGERAFKVERRNEARTIHYLSHHKRTKTSRECDARIEARMKTEAQSKQKFANDNTVAQGQGLRDRVDALARILAVQFPDVAKHANEIERRIQRNTSRTKDGYKMPEILVSYSAYASMFQIAARLEGAVVHDEDVMRYTYTENWLSHVATIRRWGVDDVRRTRCDEETRQEAWARDMTALVCLAQSEEALSTLLCHAWADLCINGVAGGNRHHVEAVRRMKMASDIVVGPGLKGLMDERISDPLTSQGDPYYVPATAVLVARMRDILREIDYSVPVPAAKTIATMRHLPLRMNKEDQGPNPLLSSVGAQAMKLGGKVAHRAN